MSAESTTSWTHIYCEFSRISSRKLTILRNCFCLFILGPGGVFSIQKFRKSLDTVPLTLCVQPDCLILHDVDHVPERQGMFYFCSIHGITHLSHAIDRLAPSKCALDVHSLTVYSIIIYFPYFTRRIWHIKLIYLIYFRFDYNLFMPEFTGNNSIRIKKILALVKKYCFCFIRKSNLCSWVFFILTWTYC